MVPSSDLLYSLLEVETFLQGADWIWAFEQMQKKDPCLPHLFDGHMYHFRYPINPQADCDSHFGQGHSDEPTLQKKYCTVGLKVATFNVLTLDSKKAKTTGTGPTGRHLSLLQQCDEHHLHIVGVQETRALKTTNRSNPFYHIVASPCRSRWSLWSSNLASSCQTFHRRWTTFQGRRLSHSLVHTQRACDQIISSSSTSNCHRSTSSYI